jgi:uncharacterized protein YjiS (DUF1127 family)
MQNTLKVSCVIDRAVGVTCAVQPTLRRGYLGVRRLIKTIWSHRAVLTELDGLTDADLRDISINPGDISQIAWDEARRRSVGSKSRNI